MSATTRPTVQDKLSVMAHRMTDVELRATIEEICGNPKRAGYRARRLNVGESLALAALMAEEARRVTRVPGPETKPRATTSSGSTRSEPCF